MRTPLSLGTLLLLISTAPAPARQTADDPMRWWAPAAKPVQLAYEESLDALAKPESLRAWHERFAAEPHIAGTEGDQRNIERLIESFIDLGLEVQVHEFWAYLAYPEAAAVEVIGAAADGGDLSLSIRETPAEEDPFDDHPDLTIGFNAYSGSGDVTARIVYANYGTKDDFDALAARGVRLNGAIVLARYGGNYRGFKARFAEAAGAAGLIIYTDPADAGFVKGEVYPKGGWANETYIQRGSIVTMDYVGDPLTPFEPATENAQRLDPELVALPRIPVQPIGYGAAREILSRMSGDPLPEDLRETWQGGLPLEYRLTGGDLRVRLMVRQKREVRRTANVLATLVGETYPDERIYIGCHHDAWCNGAGDPLSGTMLLYEAAKCFAALADQGQRPARSIVFANWGAEEFGIIGSVEYVEQFRDEIAAQAVAYINLDAATMGPNFHSSASPSLKQVIEDVTRRVPQAGRETDLSVYEAWRGEKEAPEFGSLGGGSDHIGFYCHVGIPSCGIGAGGAPGTAYHSNYDNTHWYQKAIGADYAPALMLTRVLNRLTARLANAIVLPFDPVAYTRDARTHLGVVAGRAGALGVEVDFNDYQQQLVDLDTRARVIYARLLDAIGRDMSTMVIERELNLGLRQLETDWHSSDGLPGRPWFKNLFAATDPTSGYAAWMLPGLRVGVERQDESLVRDQLAEYGKVIRRLGQTLDWIERTIPQFAIE